MEENKDLNNIIQYPSTDNNSADVLQKEEIETVTFSEFVEKLDVSSDDDHVNLSFKIENFEGPLDLLLHLIKKSKLEIEDVKLSEITEQYLQIMKQIESVDLEVASEFIEVAATLIEIKSKALLPKLLIGDEEEEEDPELLLMQRLNEYKLFKEACEKLRPLDCISRFYKEPEPSASKFRVVLKDMTMDMLINAFTGILSRVSVAEVSDVPKEVKKESYTEQTKTAAIRDALALHNRVMFSQLFEDSSTRGEIVVTFKAILELLKLQEIKVIQNDIFGDIEILKAEEIHG